MSTQQFRPLTDEALRAHLSRRAEAPPPPSLAGDVFEALDRVPVRVRAAGLPSFRPGWGGLGLGFRIPRLAAAALSIALVLAVGLGTLAILPALRSPSSTAAGAQPLTTAELAALAANASTPVNATLVASTTIKSKPDACPMDRYPTVGILVGTIKQVCVIGSGVDAYLRVEPVTGVFAFRVMAPGVLGLLGQLTPQAAGSLTYKVVDDWPLQGKTFLVDGWLGETETKSYCLPATTLQGDVLDPAASGCPYEEWLSDDSTPAAIPSRSTIDGAPDRGLALLGKTRRVEAAGMRIVDGLARGAAVHGLFVVKSVTEGCPEASSVSSRGCSAWRVLARVSDIGLGKSSPSPAASSPAPSDGSSVWDPVDRPLTAAELGRVLAAGTAKTGQTLVANVTVESSEACVSPSGEASWGQVQGVSPPVCVFASPSISIAPSADKPAILAFRVVGPSTLGYVGFVTSASGRLAFSADGFWPAGAIFLVDGVLGSYGLNCPLGDRPATASPHDVPACRSMWLVNPDKVGVQYGGAPARANRVYRTPDDGLGTSPGGHGVYLVQTAAATCSAEAAPTTAACSTGNLLAAVDPVTIPPAASTPPATALPTPTGPMTPASSEPPALIGPGDRALTVAEAQAAVKALPSTFTPRLAVVAGPLPVQDCSAYSGIAAALSCTMSPTAGRTWLAKVTREGNFSPVGRIETPAGRLVSAVADAYGAKPSDGQKIVVVDAWLAGAAMDACDIKASPLPACDEVSWLSADGTAQAAATDSPSHLAVWPGDYHRYSGGAAGGGAAVRALYAVELRPDGARILARLEVVASPSADATVTPDASASPEILMSPHTSVLVGKGNVPLTLDQVQAAFLQDPKDLVWQLAIVSGTIPPSIGCLPLDGPGGASAPVSPACGDEHSGSGPWLIRLNDSGQPEYAGRVDAGPAGLAWDVASLSKAKPKALDSTFLVSGWLLGAAATKCDQGIQGGTPPPCNEYAWLSPRHETATTSNAARAADDVSVWVDAQRFGATSAGSALSAVYGTFLVNPRWNGTNSTYILSRAVPADG